MNPNSLLLLSSFAIFGVSVSQAVTYDFSDSAQLSENFTNMASIPGGNNAMTVQGGVLRHDVTGGFTTSAVYRYTPGGTAASFDVSETPFTVSMDIKPPTTTGTQSTSFGVWFSDASNSANNLLGLFNVNLNGGANADSFRVFRDGNLSSGLAGTIVGSAQNFGSDAVAPGAADFVTVSFSLTSTLLSVTVGSQSYSQSIAGNIDWTATHISIRATDGAGGGTTEANFLQMDNFTTSIPEPSTYAVFVGALGLGCAVLRRNRRVTV